MIATMIPGRGGAAVAALGDRAVLSDLYDEVGWEIYHQISVQDSSEVRELLTLMRAHRGPVLELAAGTGRITVPLLAAGREVVALELSPSMLQGLRERLASAPARLRDRCTLVQGDMREFSLGRDFPVIVLGTSSVSLLDREGRQQLFHCVRRHLAPGGRFLLTTVLVNRSDAPEDDDFEFELTTPDGRQLRIFEHWSLGAEARTAVIMPADPPAEGRVPVCVTTIRVLPPEQLRAELATAGLRVFRTVPVLSGQRHADHLLEVGVEQ